MSKTSRVRRDSKKFDKVVRRIHNKTKIPQVKITDVAADLLEREFTKPLKKLTNFDLFEEL